MSEAVLIELDYGEVLGGFVYAFWTASSSTQLRDLEVSAHGSRVRVGVWEDGHLEDDGTPATLSADAVMRCARQRVAIDDGTPAIDMSTGRALLEVELSDKWLTDEVDQALAKLRASAVDCN